jgi:hypothetical protein
VVLNEFFRRVHRLSNGGTRLIDNIACDAGDALSE